MSFNPTNILIKAFVKELKEGYTQNYGGMKGNYAEIISWCGNMALEIIATSDALYHNVEHTMLVTLVGQEILRGKHIKEGKVSPEDWLHTIISLLMHDIGYVGGALSLDQPEKNMYATGVNDEMITLVEGMSDVSLTPYHVDRGKMFVQERFGGHGIINATIIKKNIELTRFPVPNTQDHKDTKGFPGLCRAADLIGQLGDPAYLRKVTALYAEFEETKTNEVLGYKNVGDLRKGYHTFYWKVVYPYLKDALSYLRLTQNGRLHIATLYANVFTVEHAVNKGNPTAPQLCESLQPKSLETRL